MDLLIVIAIVIIAAFVVGRRLLRAAGGGGAASPGCGSCGQTCGGCPSPPRQVGIDRSTSPPPLVGIGRRPPGAGPATAALLVLALAAAPARASDTTEVWDDNASEVALALGMTAGDRSSRVEMTVGHGLTPRLSVYVGTRLALDPELATGPGELYFGTFGSLVDSAHLDLDLLLGGSTGPDGWGPGAGIEVNLDAAPDLTWCGLYSRLELAVLEPTLAITAGGYLTVARDHQLLLEYLTEAGDLAGAGAVAVGYNFAVGDSVEIINQLSVDIPQPGEGISLSIMTGVLIGFGAGAATSARPASGRAWGAGAEASVLPTER